MSRVGGAWEATPAVVAFSGWKSMTYFNNTPLKLKVWVVSGWFVVLLSCVCLDFVVFGLDWNALW